MTEETSRENPAEKRVEARETLEKMQSLELKLPNLPIYVFKVKETSPHLFSGQSRFRHIKSYSGRPDFTYEIPY